MQKLSFHEALPLLVSTYHQGRLVPFIGAGMSSPLLNLWEPFVANLERAAQVTHYDQASLDLRAQRAATEIRNRCGPNHFIDTLRQALKADLDHAPIPPQTVALAAIRWPLVISTNYDDLFFGACRCRKAGCALASEVVGRSPSHCKRVVSGLSSPFDREYIWHVQGFLGGQYPDPQLQADVLRLSLDALQQELVVGHNEYRLVTNTAVHFRRCFGTIFQSRSLLFLGSNLTEPYFMNLFGEVLDLCGPSSVPHFAFTRVGSVDSHLLAEQMNITVCEFEDWSELPDWLAQLRDAVDQPVVRTCRYSFCVNSRADLEIIPGTAPLCASEGVREAIAFAARKDSERHPLLADRFRQEILNKRFPNARFPDSKHVVRYGDSEFYAVTARDTDSKTAADSSAVYSASQELLDRVVADGFDRLNMELPAVGGTVPPVYAFMEAVRSFGFWKKQNVASALNVTFYVADDVLLNLSSNRIDIRELLTSDLTRFWAVISADATREPARRALYYAPDIRLRVVLTDLAVPCSPDWSISVSPSPHPDGQVPPEAKTAQRLADRSLVDIGVVFGSILTIERTSGAGCPPAIVLAA